MFFIRKIDSLGRFVLPIEIRNELRLKSGDNLKIQYFNKNIIISKYSLLSNNLFNILKIINLFQNIFKCNILLIDEFNIINNQQIINIDTFNLINQRKIINSDYGILKINDNIILNNNYILHPIIFNGDIICTILIYNIDSNILKNVDSILTLFIKSFYE